MKGNEAGPQLAKAEQSHDKTLLERRWRCALQEEMEPAKAFEIKATAKTVQATTSAGVA